LNELAYRKLNAEEKIRLMDGFSALRMFYMIPLFILFGIYFLLITFTNLSLQYLAYGYFIFYILIVFFLAFLSQKTLSKLGLPSNYRWMFTVAQIISLIGIAWFSLKFLELMLIMFPQF
ncbi:MAG: hypothetical protein AB4290_23225, partial [Spirulina sp.]